ncbi:hypothetical protein BDN72DRAFT_841533 [Pluteus cervinus]|uniref:Uncharacterized protein n=1 Tax=Pluteus cervinus TaxID=181527 RepID=A0ACD3ATK1_9AGAR|nr:hypothetical protein BDN72DRAFT_841533 [Pluteus cervinus]
MLTGDRDELRRKIDGEIAALSECMRVLKVSRNALAPVNFLPPEITSRIFLLVRDFVLGDAPEQYAPQKPVGWLPITQVSQQWRQVAIGYATLWSELPWRNEKLSQLFLSRARGCPLTLSMDLTKSYLPLFRSALQSLPQIRSLQINGQLRDWGDLVPSLCLPSPELEELEIGFLAVAGTSSISWPHDLLGGNAPKLRRLTLHWLPFVRYLPIFHGLTVLFLDKTVRQTPLGILLDALGRMPNLTSLTIKERNQLELSGNDIQLASLSRPVSMPNLQDVTIHCQTFERPLLLFSSLQFAQSPTLELQCPSNVSTANPNPFPRLLQVLRSTYPSGMTPFSRMRIGATHRQFNLIAWDIPTHVTFTVKMTSLSENMRNLLPDWINACEDLPLAQLESLELYGCPHNRYDVFTQFDDLEKLKHITVEREEGYGLIEFLQQNFEDHYDDMKASITSDEEEDEELLASIPEDTCDDGEAWYNIVLPALEVITLRDLAYNDQTHPYWVQSLKARQRHGHGLKKIVVEECSGMTAERVRDLQSVAEVEWDGSEILL